MSFDRSPFRALCEAVWLFQRECKDAELTASLTINLDPESLARVMRSEEFIFQAEHLPNGAIRIMDAIIIPRRLNSESSNGH